METITQTTGAEPSGGAVQQTLPAEDSANKQTMALVEKHIIRPSNPYFEMLKEFCHLSKNLYNHGLYIARQTFMSDGLWARYARLEAETRKDAEFPDYRAMPTAQMAQQTLRALDANLASFFKAIKAWKKNKSKFTGRPKLPRYLPKDGYFEAVVTNQNAHLKKDGLIHFPKAFNGFTVEPQFPQKCAGAKFQQARITFDGVNVYVELIYRIPTPKPMKDNGRYMAIDPGVTNLAVCVTNTGAVSLIFRGSVAKAINQYYNKELAKKKSCLGKRNKRKSSKAIARLSKKRNRKMNDLMHKVARRIVDECVAQNISVIVIGKNKGWKVAPKMSKFSNQKFVPIPLARLIELIEYKAKLQGIAVLTHEESYTSGTSFLDGELPTKKFYDKSRRKERGLFVSNTGIKINADVNGAFQIMRKVFPKVTPDGIEGAVLRPVVVAA